MPQIYLRVEGVNLDNFVYDTSDLSTTRGGGLLLLRAIERIPDIARQSHPTVVLTPISTGASAGLFEFEAEESAAAKLRESIESHLSDDPALKQATFVVDALTASNDFPADGEKLLALNRWRQLQQSSLAFPQLNTTLRDACGVDGVRVADFERKVKGEATRVSASVAVRRDYGISEKQNFYASEVERLIESVDNDEQNRLRSLLVDIRARKERFVFDLDQLSGDSGNLDHKIAVVYADGNGFGSRSRGLKRDELRTFDHTLKRYRRTFLARLLERVANDSAWHTAEKQWRLETLLWGGDEFLLVVPAWKGWETLALFFEQSRTWELDGPLTHAASIVFCHHKAPIQRVASLARDLVGKAKERSRDANLFAYEVLESFDHIGPKLDEYRKKKIGSSGDAADLILAPEALKAASDFDALRATLPRSKVFEIAKGIRAGKDVSLLAEKTRTAIDARHRESLDRILRSFCGRSASSEVKPGVSWIHLAELWDYLPSRREEVHR